MNKDRIYKKCEKCNGKGYLDSNFSWPQVRCRHCLGAGETYTAPKGQKNRSEQIQNALESISYILKKNELEISEHNGGLSLYDKKENKMFFFEYQVIPSKTLGLWSIEDKNE